MKRFIDKVVYTFNWSVAVLFFLSAMALDGGSLIPTYICLGTLAYGFIYIGYQKYKASKEVGYYDEYAE